MGMNVRQYPNHIVVNQNHYLDSVEIPEVNDNKNEEDLLDVDGQAEYRAAVGKVGWLGGISRPDLAFDHVVLSCKLGKATQGDLKNVVKVLKKLKAESTEMMFPNLEDPKDWVLQGYGDASFKNLPDGTGSCGGKVIMLVISRTGLAGVVSWRSKKLKRVALSTTAAEAMAANETVNEMVYIKAVLIKVFGSQLEKLPMQLMTDSKNLWKAVKTTALVEDPRMRLDLAALKESRTMDLSDFKLVNGKGNISDCLTKKGASAKKLLNILKKGRME